MDVVFEVLKAFADTLVNWNSRLAMLYLCLTVLIVYVIWRARGKPSDFMSFLLPRSVYLHKSNLVDLKVFVFNKLLSVSGFFAVLTLTPLMTAGVLDMMLNLTGGDTAPAAEPDEWGKLALATLIIIATLDFCKYWVHRWHHQIALLWPFHSLHHSAEVLTPLTVSRVHPFYMVLRILISSFGFGFVQALMLFLLMGKIDILTIGTANAGYFIFNAFGANLRHSHVWLSYGQVLEHVFISPAQHQVHHSTDPKHFNKNYGEIFAIWDWIFGSLYVPPKHEVLTFGLADEQGNLLEQPHPTLRAALFHPFVEAWVVLSKAAPDEQPTAQDTKAAQ